MEQPPEPGILRPEQARRYFDYQRHLPPAGLAGYLENFWTVTWDLPPGQTYTAQVLPYPSVNLSVTNTECDVTGLCRRRYDRHLAGRGYAVGARFRPGCFRPFTGEPVARLTDRHRPVSTVLGRPTAALERAVAAEADVVARVELLADYLLQDPPVPDKTAQLMADTVGEIAQRADLTRVSEVAERTGVSVRSLQRLFSDYVGAGPKWVIQRCRLQDAAARAGAAIPVDWSELAAELGFADQAHLTRAFTATIGVSPAAYARQAQGG